MEHTYKTKIIDFVEGRADAAAFLAWLEAEPQVFDWLQSILPAGKTMREPVEVKMDVFLAMLPAEQEAQVWAAHRELCALTDAQQDRALCCAKTVVDALYGLLSGGVELPTLLRMVLPNLKKAIDAPAEHNSAAIKQITQAVKSLFEQTYTTVQELPYDVRAAYRHCKRGSRIWTYVNLQSLLHRLMAECYPDEPLKKDEALHQKACFMMDVCPEYIEGHEIDQADIIEKIVDQVPETLPRAKRVKQIKAQIKQAFHLSPLKHPIWVQGGEWPVAKSGKPMRFVGQKRKKGKEYENMLYTVYTFEDVDTGEIRTIEQFT